VLGKPLVAELRARGHDVYGCDLMHTDDPQSMRADIGNHRELGCVFGEFYPQLVYHLAGEFGRKNGQSYYERMWRTNVIGTRNVIEWCLRQETPLLFASSSEAYGDLADRHELLTEELLHTEVPIFHCDYALSKYVGEKQLETARNRGLMAVAFRFFNVWGPGEKFSPYRSVVCQFTHSLLTVRPVTVYRNCYRDFLHVSDWSRTMANAADRVRSLKHTAYNVGGTDFRSMENLWTTIKERLEPVDVKTNYLDIEDGNVVRKRPDITRAALELDHKPKVTIETGIREYSEWMRNESK